MGSWKGESVTVQLVILAGLSVSIPDRPVNFPGQSVTFHIWVLELGVLYNPQALNSNRQAGNCSQQACNTNRQAGNCNRQAGNIFGSYGLSVSKSVAIKRPVDRHLYIWALTCQETIAVQI